MANNEGYIEVISKIKPANRTAFKVADASDIEYNGIMNEKDKSVTSAQDAIDTIYDIITAKPKFWLKSDSRLISDGVGRVNVSVQTQSIQGSYAKLIITNKTTGETKTISHLPISSQHNIDLGVISSFGTYEYSITATDDFNNAMVVNTAESSPGSYNQKEAEENIDQYELKFSVISGNVRLSISSMDRVDNSGANIIINNKTNIYSTNTPSNIRLTGTIQYPEINTNEIPILHSMEYNIYSREVYFKTDKNIYVPAYKYDTLINRNISHNYGTANKNTLYYKYKDSDETIKYISIDDYNISENNYNIDETMVGIFYDFVENKNGTGEFIQNPNNNKYEVRPSNSSYDITYDLIPAYINTNTFNRDGSPSTHQLKLIDTVQFNIKDVYFYTEEKYIISSRAVINKTYMGEELIEYSKPVDLNIYPINDTADGSIKAVPVTNIPKSITTDDDISIRFMLLSSINGISTLNFKASLYYVNGESEQLIKTSVRESCKNLEEQVWNIGRVTKGEGHYYYTIEINSFDNSISGDVYEYHFNVTQGKTTTDYITDGLVAYWDASTMSNDTDNPDMWYPVVPTNINNKIEMEKSNKYYIKLFGLNYSTNGWVSYNKDNNKHPHLKFTGNSYGLAYRLSSGKNEQSLSIMDLLDPNRIEDASSDEMTFEIMFRSRCVGEMKACVLSSRREESNQISLYTYSDTDKQIASPGITISHNKTIINSNRDYLVTPYNQDEWKHVTFVINRNTNSDNVNYNPFSSMRIYINGVLTSLTKIEDTSLFTTYTQMVLNGHLNNNIVENFGTSEVRLIRMYNKALSNNQIVSNYISSIYDQDDREKIELKNDTTINSIPIIHFIKNSSNGVDKRKDAKNTTFSSLMKITDKGESKSSFVNCTMHYQYPNPDPSKNDMILETLNNVDVYLQGTSTLQFPVKNLKIKTYKDGDTKSEKESAKSLKYVPSNMEDKWIPDTTYTLKCDYMESGHLNNTPTAKFYHNVVEKLLTSNVDKQNPNVRPLSKKEYLYTQDNINGTHFIDSDGSYKEADSSYVGEKYKKSSSIKEVNSGSPSRDYYEVVKYVADSNDDKQYIYYTSNNDINECYKINKLDESISKHIEDDEIDLENYSYYYMVPNTYYVKLYDSEYNSLKWVEYSPIEESHHDKILYRLNTKYRDSIDGFPCIVYYTDDTDENGTGFNDNRSDLTLLGTMMFNLDKTGKGMGFEISPVYEDEYDEYLNSKYLELEVYSNSGLSLSNFKKLVFTDIENIYNHIHIDGITIVSFKDFYYGNDEDSDLYGTIPTYVYDQQYILDPNGNYIYDTALGKYILSDISGDNIKKYSLIFNNYRTYHIDDKYNNIRLDKQCTLSYEATTNTRYAAGTFYDITEAYNVTYGDDFVNQYYNEHFLKPNGIDPRLVKDYSGTQISPVSSADKEDVVLSVNEFKNLLIGDNSIYKMDSIIPTDWDKSYFKIDENEAGPYVYVCNGEIGTYEKDTNGNFELYNKDIHGIIANNLRYKFYLPFKSYSIAYEQSSDGEYYKDENGVYKRIPSNEDISKYVQYKQVLSDEKSFEIVDKRSYIGDKLSGDDESYLNYILGSFEARYSYINEHDISDDEEDPRSYLAMKNLIKWINDSISSTKDISSTTSGLNKFRDEFREHFDLTYVIAYYLQMLVFAQADNAGKNSMWDTWDGKKFYIRPYDMDTQAGLNNKGLFNVPTSAEINIDQSPREFTDTTLTQLANISNWNTDKNHNRYRSYTTSTSRFWNAFAIAFKDEIREAYSILRRNGIYTEKFILDFYKANSIDIIGEKYYNEDMNAKYLSQGDPKNGTVTYDYLNLLMGNRIDQFSKWISERLIFCDTYFNYIDTDTLNTQLAIRTQNSNSVSIGISVFSPQYVKISMGSGEDVILTSFIDTSSKFILNGVEYEGTLFTLPVVGDNKELSIYGGGNIKEIINIESLQPSTLELGNAKKLTKLEIAGNNFIEGIELTNASYLRELDVSNCLKLTGNLDVSNSINLNTLNISKTNLSGVTLADGGNLTNFIANDTTISTLEFKNLQQLQNIQISTLNGSIPVTSYTMIGCPLIKTLDFTDYVNIEKLRIEDCDNLTSLVIENNRSLKELSVSRCNNLRILNLENSISPILKDLNLSTIYSLDTLNITNCKTGDDSNGINVIFPVYRDETIRNSPDNKYDDRWHNLKTLRCTGSDIQSISYGTYNDDNKNLIDMTPLSMLTTVPSFNSCSKVKYITGLKFTGNLPTSINTLIFNGTSIESISNSSIELATSDQYTDSGFSYLFNGCLLLKDFQTLNLDPYSKQPKSKSNMKLSLAGVFNGANTSSEMLDKIINTGREYNLIKVSEDENLPTSNTDYECQEYLIRDTQPRYVLSNILATDKLYVYDNSKFIEYDKTKHKDIKITYYKDRSSNYIYNKFGLYIECEISSDDLKGYMSVDSDVYELNSDQSYSGNGTIRNLPASYNVEGNIVKKTITSNSIKYYRFYNNKWTEHDIYTYYNKNSDGLYIDRECTIPITTRGNELYDGEYYIKNDENLYNTSSRKNRYYKIYNPEEYNNEQVYRKEYIETDEATRYIETIFQICRNAKTSGSNKLQIIPNLFDGLEKCSNASSAFHNTNIEVKPNIFIKGTTAISEINSFLTEFKKLKNLTNASWMFYGCTSITILPDEMFKTLTKLTDVSYMFCNCTNLVRFSGNNNGMATYTKIFVPTDEESSPITNISYIFSSTGLYLSNVNDMLLGLNKVTDASGMFSSCKGTLQLKNRPLKDMISVTDIRYMFSNCANLNIHYIDNELFMPLSSENGFILFDDDETKEYSVTRADYLFYNCTSLTGYIDKKFFGNVKTITSLSHTFANTGIYSYHQDFLSKLKNLTNVTCLFAKIENSKISKNHKLCMNMYGYIVDDDNKQSGYDIKPGISPDIFINNTKLENVSYVFAGNHGLERTENLISGKFGFTTSVDKLPNIFRKCPNIKYMIGTFMGTTIHPSDLLLDNNYIKKDVKYYTYLKGTLDDDNKDYTMNELIVPNPTYVYLNEFFKANGEGMKYLESVESLFENSNYSAYDNNENVSDVIKISSDTFKDCIKLKSTKNMFKNNVYLSGKDSNTVPIAIDLFEPCKGTIENVSGMFAGCYNMKGILPTGDNTIFVSYMNYLNNIKTDPDVIQIYPNIAKLNNDILFDNISNNMYPNQIVQYYDEDNQSFIYEKILSFNEFIDKYKSKAILRGYINLTEKLRLEPIITSYVDNDKYVKVYTNIPSISKLKTMYFRDRISKTILPSDVGQRKIVDKIIETISESDIGKKVDFAIFGEIGTYSYDESIGTSFTDFELNNRDDIEFKDSKDFPDSKNKFVQKTLMVLDNSNLDYTKYQNMNICKINEDTSIINDSNTTIYKNRRFLPYINYNNTDGKVLTIAQNYDNKLSFILNGDLLPEYDKDSDLDTTYLLYPSIAILEDDINKAEEYKYYRGLLGSCTKLSDASSMFEGCTGLYGPIPRDIFSAESANTSLNSLINISSMFKGCYLLSTNNGGSLEFANPETMYSRNKDTLELDNFGTYLIPEDWLKYTPKIQYINSLFSRVATLAYNGTYESDITSVDVRNNYINGKDGIEFLGTTFSDKQYIVNASYLLYGSPLINGTLTNQFLRSSVGTLTDITGIFACTSISHIGSTKNLRIFESETMNSRLTKVSGAFANCSKLKSIELDNNDGSVAPRFYLTNKFNKISDYTSCYYGTSLLTNVEDAKDINSNWTSSGYAFRSTTGYYNSNISYDELIIK